MYVQIDITKQCVALDEKKKEFALRFFPFERAYPTRTLTILDITFNILFPQGVGDHYPPERAFVYYRWTADDFSNVMKYLTVSLPIVLNSDLFF